MEVEQIGYCCGTIHLYDFYGRASENRLKVLIRNSIYENNYGTSGTYEKIIKEHKLKRKGYLVTAILTEDQKKSWDKYFKKLNFKIVSKWRNINSNNLLYLYTMHTGYEYVLR
jgi:hypothetical protein